MKTFTLATLAFAIGAAASTSAMAANMDLNGNIPNHHSDELNGGYSDTFIMPNQGPGVRVVTPHDDEQIYVAPQRTYVAPY